MVRGFIGHGVYEAPVTIFDREQKRTISGWLVAMRLPEGQVEKGSTRLAREYGSCPTDLDREAAAYLVLFTTVPRSWLDGERCLALHHLRWQAELLFKRWQSPCGFDRLPNYLDDAIHAWLYAKVLLALLMQRMASSAPPGAVDFASTPTNRRWHISPPS